MHNITQIFPTDAAWPARLNDLGADAPKSLWVRGDRDLAKMVEQSVSIVGARAATAYGGHIASELGYNLTGKHYTVISGGAFGIDALAHRGALANSGLTVAVLPCGVDIAYPRSHDRLFERIAQEGLLVSEYEPGTNPQPYKFLARNRLIAALSQGTVVVEATLRSGSLNTARQANGIGRSVMAVPGPVTSAMSVGVHSLIREGTATMVTSADDIDALLTQTHLLTMSPAERKTYLATRS
jgi:DNA processing protein